MKQPCPRNDPVGFRVNTELGTIDIGGFNLGKSRKYANIHNNPQVAFVVDDLVSVQPWQVRGIEIRGRAEAPTGLSPEQAPFGAELIRIYPKRILTWGLDLAEPGMHAHRHSASLLGLGRRGGLSQ